MKTLESFQEALGLCSSQVSPRSRQLLRSRIHDDAEADAFTSTSIHHATGNLALSSIVLEPGRPSNRTWRGPHWEVKGGCKHVDIWARSRVAIVAALFSAPMDASILQPPGAIIPSSHSVLPVFRFVIGAL